MLNSLNVALMPYVLELVALLLTALIAYAVKHFTALTGIQIEAKHRDALHSALMTGVRIAIDKGLTGQSAVDIAVDYARTSVPEAIAKLNPDVGTLVGIARAKIVEAATPFAR